MLVVTYATFTAFKAAQVGLLSLQKFYFEADTNFYLCTAMSIGSGVCHRFYGSNAGTDLWFSTALECIGMNV